MNKILEPEFVDLQKTTVRFKILSENGSISVAELKVPEKQARGVNEYWDRILDEFSVEKMRSDRNLKETRARQEQEIANKKRVAQEENAKLRRLFEKKMKAFELPYINNAADDIKAAVRRAPDEAFLDAVLLDQMLMFIKNNNMNYVDYLDYLDEVEEQKENKE